VTSDFAPEVAKYNFGSVRAYCFAPLAMQLVNAGTILYYECKIHRITLTAENDCFCERMQRCNKFVTAGQLASSARAQIATKYTLNDSQFIGTKGDGSLLKVK